MTSVAVGLWRFRPLAFPARFVKSCGVGIFSKAKKVDPAAALRQAFGSQVAARLDANPAVQRIAMDTVQFYYQAPFLDPATCKQLIAVIDSKRRPSTLLSDRPNSNFRTSESCDMDRWSPDVQPTDEAIATLLGIDLVHGETMQGQRYAPGQQFRAHHDYFHESESYWARMQEQGGQRTWTAMVFLNDVPEGGATWFPQAGIKIAPKRGMLLAWNNMNPDGSPNGLTLHEGMPVMEGVKYIVTKWFRERPWMK